MRAQRPASKGSRDELLEQRQLSVKEMSGGRHHGDGQDLRAGPVHHRGQRHIVDVRRQGVFNEAPTMLPSARWADPVQLQRGAVTAAPGEPVIAYCVYGHEVSRAAALQLRAAGIDARFLVGGIDGWARAGRPLVPKGTGGGQS